MTAPAEGDALGAALIQISSHAERIAVLDTREAGHHHDVLAQLRAITAETATASTRIDGIGTTLARHSAIVGALDGLDDQVATLARAISELAERHHEDEHDPRYYRPGQQPRWWKLTGPDRDAALDRLRAWVDQIYRPGYGKLAAALPPCWDQHPLCLYTLDWLSELWSVLHLRPQRNDSTLASQAEWQTRLLPAAAEQMAYDATGCQHSLNGTRHPRDYPQD
jgi:hypothetical protein